MSDAGRELRIILDRSDRKLARYLEILNEDFKPNADGSITFTSRTFETSAKLRRRYRAVRRRITAVDGGGKAKRALLAGLDEIDAGMADFASAARIGFSVEQVAALRAAARKVDDGANRVRKVRKGLPG
jgi:hypothetical protein